MRVSLQEDADMAEPVQTAGVNRIIAGTVAANGTAVSGQEFTSLRTSQGHYVVSFQPRFASISGGSVTQVYPNDGDTRDNAVIIALTSESCYYKTGDNEGKASDRSATFIFAGIGSAAAAE